MNTTEFLCRVLPGAAKHLAIAWKNQYGSLSHRFYTRDKVADAASMLAWVTSKRLVDSWYAVAGFEEAVSKTDSKGNPVLDGSRTQANASHLKCFWIDIDVQRDKPAKNLYPTVADAKLWLAAFLAATGLPPPNVLVKSGYGLHVYWVLQDDMTKADWQPYAYGLRDALKQHQFICEEEISSDAARLMRAPGTNNFKMGPPGVPVTAHSNQGDYPNELVLSKLRPYISASISFPGTSTPAHSPLTTGAPAPALVGTTPNLNAAAQTRAAPMVPRFFSHIATKCEQVKMSMATGGAGDSYRLWYLGFMSLAAFCEDGVTYAHEISKGDPRYTAAEVTKALDRATRERRNKNLGAPMCTAFDGYRNNVCKTCPHFGRVISPFSIGTNAPDSDLPEGYKREAGEIKHQYSTQKMGIGWERVVGGDVYAPTVYNTAKGYAISFTYEKAGKKFPIHAVERDISAGSAGIGAYFATQSVTLYSGEDKLLREFIVAWIDTVRMQRGERTDMVEPFGYATNEAGDHIGISLAGTLYRRDGGKEAVPGGDPGVIDNCKPRGTYAKWREAFDLVCGDCVGRQAIVAASFGSPLMHFTGQKGLLISAYGESGIAKSAAMAVSQSVWGAPSLMSVLGSTDNAMQKKAGDMKFLPMLWDEAQLNQKNADILLAMMFGIAQGQGKSRLNSNIELQPIATWQCLAQVCSNSRLMDFVADRIHGHDAGGVRLFEFEVRVPKTPPNAGHAMTVQNTQMHYGHAGQMLVEYLSAHYDEVKIMVHKLIEKLNKDLDPTKEERIFVAAIAAMVAGCYIANREGIAKFNVGELMCFFEEKFFKLRGERRETMTTNQGVMDVMQVLNDFMRLHQPHTLITDHVLMRGVGRPPKVQIIHEPKSGRADVQIAEKEQMIRIDMSEWNQYLRAHNYIAATVTDAVCQRFNATRGERATIGAGTTFSGGQGRVLDIMLDGELAGQFATSSQQLASALDNSAVPEGAESAVGSGLSGGEAIEPAVDALGDTVHVIQVSEGVEAVGLPVEARDA